jgi:hypothetical protein
MRDVKYWPSGFLNLSFASKVMGHVSFGFAAGCGAAKPKLHQRRTLRAKLLSKQQVNDPLVTLGIPKLSS